LSRRQPYAPFIDNDLELSLKKAKGMEALGGKVKLRLRANQYIIKLNRSGMMFPHGQLKLGASDSLCLDVEERSAVAVLNFWSEAR